MPLLFSSSALPVGVTLVLCPLTVGILLFVLPGILCGHLTGGGAYFLLQKPKWPDACCPVSWELGRRAGSVLFTMLSNAGKQDSRSDWLSGPENAAAHTAGSPLQASRKHRPLCTSWIRPSLHLPSFSCWLQRLQAAHADPATSREKPTSFHVSVSISARRCPLDLTGQHSIHAHSPCRSPLGKSKGDGGVPTGWAGNGAVTGLPAQAAERCRLGRLYGVILPFSLQRTQS